MNRQRAKIHVHQKQSELKQHERLVWRQHGCRIHLQKRFTLARLAIPATGRKCWGHKGDTTSRHAPMSYITSAVHCTHHKTHLLSHNHTASATRDYWFTYSVLNLRALAPTRSGLYTKYAPAFWFRVHACTHAAAYQLSNMLHSILQYPAYNGCLCRCWPQPCSKQ
jgi:hypothetical protein